MKPGRRHLYILSDNNEKKRIKECAEYESALRMCGSAYGASDVIEVATDVTIYISLLWAICDPSTA